MSIIHEALKKTNQSIIRENDKNRAAAENMRPQVEVHRRRSVGGWAPFFLILIGSLAASPVLLPKIFKSQAAPAGAGAVASVHQQFAVEEAPLPASPAPFAPSAVKARPGKLTLTGVVYSSAESYCLINGLVLKIGDRVGDAVIESISQTEVVLDMGGQKQTLTVQQS